MINLLKHGLLIVAALMLWACADKDTADPPAELVDFDAEAKIKTLWSVDTGSGTGELRVTLAPYYYDNTLYVADYEGRIVAVDAEQGEIKWEVETETAITGGVGGNDTLLFAGTRDGELIALRQEDGSQVWKTRLSSELISVPVVDLGFVLTRTVDGTTTAFSTATGDKVWSQWHSVPALSLRGTGRPVSYGGAVFTGTDNGELTALTLAEGRTAWAARVSVPEGHSELSRMTDVDAMPIIDEGVIYAAAYQGRIIAANFNNGQILWARDKSVFLDLAISDEQLYAVDELSHVWALGKRSGSTVWTQDKLHARPLTAPVVFKDYVLAVDFEGYIHVLNSVDGRFVARSATNGSGALVAPVVHGDVFYILNRDGELSAKTIETLGG